VEQRQTAPAQDTERAVVDLETFERVWRRVMPNQDMSPIQVGAPTGPGTGVERQAERIPAPAQLQNQDQGAAPAAQIQSSAQLQTQSQVPAPAEQAAGQVRQLEELMEGAWMGHRIYLELARRARGSGARTLNALAAEQRRTAQRLAACWFLLTGACYHFSSPPIPRVCPLAAALREQFLQEQKWRRLCQRAAAEGDSTACGGLYETLDGQAEHRMEAIRCLLEQMQPLPSGG
jgi:hypothetical protein